MNLELQQMLIEDLNAKLLQRAELIGQYEELEELLEFHKTNSTFEYSIAIKLEQLEKEIQSNICSDQKIKSTIMKEREKLNQELTKRIEEQTLQVFEQYMINWISDFKGFRVIHGEEKYQQLLLEQQKQIKEMISTQYNKKIQGITQIYKQFNQIDQGIQYNIQYVDNDLTIQLNQQQNKPNQSMTQKKDDTLQLSQIIQQIEYSKQIINLQQQDDSLIQHMDEFNNIMTKQSHPIKLQTIYEEQQQNNNCHIRQHHHSKTIFSHKHSTALSPQMSKSQFNKETTLKKSLTKGTLLLKKFSNKTSKREFDVFQHQNPTQLGYGLRMAQLTQDRIEFRNQLKPQIIDSSLLLSQILRVIIPKQIQGYLKRRVTKIKEKENNIPNLSYWPMQILTLNQGQIDLLFYSQDHMMDWYNGLMNIHQHIHHLQSSSSLDTQLLVVGVVCITFSILLLWFNERRAAINSYRLQYARQHCISLTSFQESNPQDLIHVTGQLITDELITDKDFGVSQINCVKLLRNVEMFQWVKGEKQQEQKWVDNYVQNHFGYTNDKSKWILNSETILNSSVKLNQYQLADDMKKQLNTPIETVKLNQANVQIAQQKFKHSGFSRFLLQDDYIYMHQVEDQIVNGDIRISFKQVTCSDVTIIAKGIMNSLVVWQFEDIFNQTVARDYQEHERTCCHLPVPIENKPIKEIYWIFQGLFTPEECFSKIVNENSLLFWIFRIIGYILIAVGTIILLSPVSFLTEFIPTTKLTGFKFLIFGSVSAIPITILSVCISWIYYRPKIGLLMLLISIILGGSIFYYGYLNQ